MCILKVLYSKSDFFHHLFSKEYFKVKLACKVFLKFLYFWGCWEDRDQPPSNGKNTRKRLKKMARCNHEKTPSLFTWHHQVLHFIDFGPIFLIKYWIFSWEKTICKIQSYYTIKIVRILIDTKKREKRYKCKSS